jgi:hypothetical protein
VSMSALECDGACVSVSKTMEEEVEEEAGKGGCLSFAEDEKQLTCTLSPPDSSPPDEPKLTRRRLIDSLSWSGIDVLLPKPS